MSWKKQLGLDRLQPLTWRGFAQTVGRTLVHNAGLKLLSVTAAFAIWLFVNAGERDTERSLQVPIEMRNRPASLINIGPQVSFVDVRLSGPRTLVNRISADELVISLDLEGVRSGTVNFRLQSEQLNLPRGVKVVRMTPSEVTLEFQRQVRKSTPVRLAVGAKPLRDIRIVEARLTPDTVEISGPERDVKGISEVDTVTLDLSDAKRGVIERDLPLAPLPEYVSASATRVHAWLRLEEPEATRVFRGVRVLVRNTEYRTSVRPEAVTLSLRGPKSLVTSLELSADAVYIDAGEQEPGDYQVGPAVNLPADIELVKIEPGTVRLRVMREKRKQHDAQAG